MILTINIFDLAKSQKLIDNNEFLSTVLIEIRRLFTAKNIRFKIKEQ